MHSEPQSYLNYPIGNWNCEFSRNECPTDNFINRPSIIDAKYANPDHSRHDGSCPWLLSAAVFPINGCHTFNVTQTINYAIGSTEISTTVKICCTCALCVPYMGRLAGAKRDELPKSVRISKSSSVRFDKYQISIASGIYDVDSGNYVNLKFSIIEN